MTTAKFKNKPGYLTTEFWLSCLVVVAATICLLAQVLDQEGWAIAVGSSTVGYSFSRGLAKKD